MKQQEKWHVEWKKPEKFTDESLPHQSSHEEISDTEELVVLLLLLFDNSWRREWQLASQIQVLLRSGLHNLVTEWE